MSGPAEAGCPGWLQQHSPDFPGVSSQAVEVSVDSLRPL